MPIMGWTLLMILWTGPTMGWEATPIQDFVTLRDCKERVELLIKRSGQPAGNLQLLCWPKNEGDANLTTEPEPNLPLGGHL